MLTACVTLGAKNTPPDWVLNPPQDSADSYWGVGEGFDLESAKRTALKDVAARMRVTISGSMDSQMTVSNDAVDRSARNRVSEIVQKTEFTRFNVEKTAVSDNGLYALVKVDRRAFIQETRFKYDNLQSQIQAALRGLSQQSPLQQYQSQSKAAALAEEATAVAHLLRVADSGFSGGNEIRALNQIKLDAQAAAAKLVFTLQYAAQDADIAQVLTAFINDNGMRVAQRGEKGLLVTIRNSVQEETLFGNRNVRMQVQLNLRDEAQQNVAVKEYRLSGNALDSYQSARKNALRQLTKAMQDAGPAEALGLK